MVVQLLYNFLQHHIERIHYEDELIEEIEDEIVNEEEVEIEEDSDYDDKEEKEETILRPFNKLQRH